MAFFYLEPHIPGQIGPKSILDTSVHPPKVERLSFQLDGWPVDPISESFPVFVVTLNAEQAIKKAGLTGVQFADMEVVKSETFFDLYGDKSPPELRWMQVTGIARQDDFGIGSDNMLVVSQGVIDILNNFGLNDAIISPA